VRQSTSPATKAIARAQSPCNDEIVELVSQLWVNPVFQARIRLSGLLLGQLASRPSSRFCERATLIDRAYELRDAPVAGCG